MSVGNLLELTTELRQINNHIKNQFEQTNSLQKTADFYNEIKPYVDEVKEKSEQWGRVARQWIMESHPPKIHTNQVKHTVENIQYASIQSFFPTTNRAKFLNYVRSIDFVLTIILKRLPHQR